MIEKPNPLLITSKLRKKRIVLPVPQSPLLSPIQREHKVLNIMHLNEALS